MGHEQAQYLPSLEPGACLVAAAIAGGVTAGEPSGVLPAQGLRAADGCRRIAQTNLETLAEWRGAPTKASGQRELSAGAWPALGGM